MEKVAVKSLQGGCVVRNTNPSFKVKFEGNVPLLLPKNVAEFLVNDNKNFVIVEGVEAEEAVKPERIRLHSKTALKDMKKAEQVELLLKHGVSENDIPKLEDDRVDLILELQKKAKEGDKP